MADYNIYIHSYSQYDAPTTPFQLRTESDTSGVGGEGGGSGGSGFGAVRRAASFFTNPDSAIGQATGAVASAAGKILPFALLGAGLSIAKKVLDLYVSYSSSATGDYSFKIKYDNYFQSIQNATKPFSAEIQRQFNILEINKNNARNEQERLLFGGTIYTDRYGRYL